jgi:N-acyl homoserine lactone hydrolase
MRVTASSGEMRGLVQLPETGPVLLTIDAVVLERMFSPDRRATPVDDNEEQLRTSTSTLLDVATREQVALVIFGHDGDRWQTLEKSPIAYE